ncbi:hypothetical protein MRB53_039504 [Persea americana]|nr:hypothetical protein MRB53_039504 [Persea americana]
MRTTPLLALLPAVAVAQQQFPTSRSTSAAAKIAELKVVPITLDNWKTTLHPGAATASPGIESWMIFVTGGNKTCYGLCKHSEEVWNQSVAVISAGTRNPPNLGLLNCEKEPVLCHGWATLPPQILHMQLPQPLPDQSTPASTVRSISFNRSSVTTEEISNLVLKDKYLETKPYDSIFQPFDGLLAKLGLQLPLGYAAWGFSLIPSWVFMIGISMLSRTFM